MNRTDKRFFLDRFEGDVAVLIPEGSETEQNTPRARLPNGAREGVWLIQRARNPEEYEIDEAGTKTAKNEVQNLMDELAGS